MQLLHLTEDYKADLASVMILHSDKTSDQIRNTLKILPELDKHKTNKPLLEHISIQYLHLHVLHSFNSGHRVTSRKILEYISKYISLSSEQTEQIILATLKDNQIAELTNRLTAKLAPLCPYQSLRQIISQVIVEYIKETKP